MNGIKMPREEQGTDPDEDDSTGSSRQPAKESPSSNDLARANLDNLMGEQKATVHQRRNSE